MEKQAAIKIVQDTFNNPFDKGQYRYFIKNLFNFIDESKNFMYKGQYIPDAFKPYIHTLERIGKYVDAEGEKIDILITHLRKETSLERARTMQRNFIAWYLDGSRGGDLKDAAIVAFHADDLEDWRFSLVKMEYKLSQTNGKVKAKKELTPARRYSFLVGENEPNHTAQQQLIPLLQDDINNPNLIDIEESFNIEKVTREFFAKYRELFLRTKEELDKIVIKDAKVRADFESKEVDTVNFAKKLMGQIVFLYFLQKKGWFGVNRDMKWGTGSKQYLRELFDKKHCVYKNFFNDILEPLFYEALRNDRSHDDDYYSRFNSKIPFLNGGLFDPIGNYNWVHTDIPLPNNLFSNNKRTKEGDVGSGILDIFDRYNFTVKEDEPLDKEVAIDPEMLGKAYEKFNAIRSDNYDEYVEVLKSGKKGAESKFNKQYGVYYTPREIVHYMCQQSLINYLHTELNKGCVGFEKLGDPQFDTFGKKIKRGQQSSIIEYRATAFIPKDDIEILVSLGEYVSENEARVLKEGRETDIYYHKLPESVRENAALIDKKLTEIKVCDPAVGSGAFLVGMMSEMVKTRNVLSLFLENPNRTTYDFKRKCIEKSLYGVDIDPGAVEIAKLRLWLSLIVDEEDIKQIKPLPNLDYKIVCGNSLLSYPYRPKGLDKIEKLKEQFFGEININKKNELRKQIDESIYGLYKNTEKSLGYKVSIDFKINFSEVFRDEDGFDIVIANPPYVSVKGRDETDKKTLKKIYGFADDLYGHFYFKALEIAAEEKGFITFISSKTFWTIQTKRNLRALLLKNRIIEIYDTACPFEAMVDTCVIIIKKIKSNDGNYSITIKDGKNDFLNPKEYEIDIEKYKSAVNNVFFIPHKFNLKIYEKYNHISRDLVTKWWKKIRTSKDIEKNKIELELYRKTLRPGDITLLGLITVGGQGLATANNGKYLGILKGTKYAENIEKSRPEKLLKAIGSLNIKELKETNNIPDVHEFLSNKSESEIRKVFDDLKKKYGRDIFGRGYLFRIVSRDEIADVNNLSNKEKQSGIIGKKTFVPYDKGDKEGNRWYLRTPYYIDWSVENVKFLKSHSGKKGEGMPVVRNPNFYFREGFCWTFTLNEYSIFFKARLKEKSVFDVNAMSLFPLNTYINSKYIISLLNSYFLYHFKVNFLNNTSGFQINDARQLPIIIPDSNQLRKFELVFNQAYEIQKSKFNGKISKKQAENQLNTIQHKLDQMVYKLYGLTEDETKVVEGSAK